MPYKSEAQRRFFNSPAGKAKIGKEEVEHWNEVSKGKELPEKAIDRAIELCHIVDKNIEFPSEKEAIQYCKENSLDPHNIILMGDKYIVKE